MDSDKSTEQDISPVFKLPKEMLEKFLQLLPFPDLLKCREVHSTWKSAATDSVRKRCAPLHLSRGDIPENQRSRAIQSFVELIRVTNTQRNVDEFPVTKFRLDLNSEYNWIETNGSTLIFQFLDAVSPFVKQIGFNLFQESFQVAKNKLVISKLVTFPNLKEITLTVFEKQIKHRDIFSFIGKVIEKSQNLDEIHLHLYEVSRSGEIRRCIGETEIQQRASLVTSLNLNAPKRASDFQYLNKLSFKLKSFRLNVFQCNIHPEVLQKFLKNQSDTLTTLRVSFANDSQFRDLPNLPCLKNLSISDLLKTGDHQLPTGFYKVQLPALKTMDLENADFPASYFIASHMVPSESLRELILPKQSIKDAGQVIRQAGRLFPNLKKLKVFHESAAPYMSDIYEALPGIEELCILTNGRENVDKIITGLPARVFAEIEMDNDIPQSHDNSYYMSRALAMLERGTTKSLACLENLKILQIHRAGDDDWNVVGGADFTELSGVVLKQMKALESIDFGVRKYGPIVSVALKEDLESHGIKLCYRRPPYTRSLTDFVELEVIRV